MNPIVQPLSCGGSSGGKLACASRRTMLTIIQLQEKPLFSLWEEAALVSAQILVLPAA